MNIFKLTPTQKSIGIIFLCTLLILGVVYVKRETIRRFLAKPSPEAVNTRLSEKIKAADQIILNLISKLSLSEDNISMSQSRLREGPFIWDHSLITIMMPSDISFSQVENTFIGGFAFFEPEDFASEILFDSDTCLNITVQIQRRKTHQLVFCHAPQAVPPSTPKPPEDKNGLRVSIVIDDLGEDYRAFKELAAMDVPFTYSVLPFRTHSVRIANEANKKNGEIILHLPLEPWNSNNHAINHGTLLTSMDNHQLRIQLAKNLEAVPHLSGVSNHMGSKFTEDYEKMEIVLKAVKGKELYFLDSRTSDRTVGFTLAQMMQIKTAQRKLFIDNTQDKQAIVKQLQKIPRLAKKNGGSVVAIGHPYPSTIAALKSYVPQLQKQGVTIVPLSQLVN
jgi:polysaccharide deacetylase 2 family uncharacterized protein YibQ